MKIHCPEIYQLSDNGSATLFDCPQLANALGPIAKRSIKLMNVLIPEEIPMLMPSIDMIIILARRLGCFISKYLGCSNFKFLTQSSFKVLDGNRPLDETIRILD